MTIEWKKGEALWSQIASEVARDIETGIYHKGEKLPTEAQFAAQYKVNRHTIRRALEELSDARIIRTEHGRGSFVAEDVMDYRIGKRPRFSEWIRSYKREPIGEILTLEEVSLGSLPEAEAAGQVLQLEPDAMVVFLERLGAADDRPVALSRHVFPLSRYPGLKEALKHNASITAALSAVGVTDYTRQWTRVCARMPDVREARLLRMARTDALLTCETLNATMAGEVVDFGSTCYPAPRVQLVFEA
jgi:GntR family transcriptional regulator, phosphonate transport system regulatory protein